MNLSTWCTVQYSTVQGRVVQYSAVPEHVVAQLRQGEGVGEAEDVSAVVQVQVGVEVAGAQPHHRLDLERVAEVTAMFDNV